MGPIMMPLMATISLALGTLVTVFNGEIYHISKDTCNLPAPYMGRIVFIFP